MRADVRPEPTPQEREALERALRALAERRPPAYGSSWRRAALRLDDPDEAVSPELGRTATRR